MVSGAGFETDEAVIRWRRGGGLATATGGRSRAPPDKRRARRSGPGGLAGPAEAGARLLVPSRAGAVSVPGGEVEAEREGERDCEIGTTKGETAAAGAGLLLPLLEAQSALPAGAEAAGEAGAAAGEAGAAAGAAGAAAGAAGATAGAAATADAASAGAAGAGLGAAAAGAALAAGTIATSGTPAALPLFIGESAAG